ncbi:MAG TPA: hypothetical protein VNK49_01725, partial [Anaerolineales bacterium]|nr:hypothetical protein [Anaerolineales bacterium]
MIHLLKLRPFLKPYFGKILLNLFILLSITGLSLVVPHIIRLVIDDGLARGDTLYLVRSALLLLGVGLVSAALNFGNRYLSEWI